MEYRTSDGSIRGAQARVLDFDDAHNNDWLAVSQFTVSENTHTRRPDVVLFINGLPPRAGAHPRAGGRQGPLAARRAGAVAGVRARRAARGVAAHPRRRRLLETNDSAVKVLGDETLRAIARELVTTVRANVTIDWTVRENVRAQLRVLVKRILRKHGYPPDKQEKATQTVLEQAEVLSEIWAAA